MAWPAAIAAVGAAGSGMLGNEANKNQANRANQLNWRMFAENQAFNQLEAQRNREFQSKEAGIDRDWQASMSNSAYQRSVKDMRAAGINPMMAFSQGGASTPHGGHGAGAQASGSPGHADKAQLEDALGKGVNSAMEATRLKKEMKAVDSQTALNSAAELTQATQQELNKQSAKQVDSTMNLQGEQAAYQKDLSEKAKAETAVTKAHMPAIKQEVQARIQDAKTQEARGKIDEQMVKVDAIGSRVGQAMNVGGNFIRNIFSRRNRKPRGKETHYNKKTGEIFYEY